VTEKVTSLLYEPVETIRGCPALAPTRKFWISPGCSSPLTVPAVALSAKLIRTAPEIEVGEGADVGGTAVGGSGVGGAVVAVGTIAGASVGADVGKASVGTGVLSAPQPRTVKVVTVRTIRVLNFATFFILSS
jgi:hypothetical protein